MTRQGDFSLEPDADRLRAAARAFTSSRDRASRERSKVLGASAAIVSQLPSDQLPEFVQRSTRLSVQLDDLVESLANAGRAVNDYAEAIERAAHADATPEIRQGDGADGGPRELESGPPLASPTLLPVNPVAGHLVGEQLPAPNPEHEVNQAAIRHELQFLRARLLDVLDETARHFLPAGVHDDLRAAARHAIMAPEPGPHADADVVETCEEVIPVELRFPVKDDETRQ